MTTSVKPYTGKRILAWIVGFFLVVFIVNGIMAYFALSTWTGLTTEDSYVKGLNYNDEIEAARQQQVSGWGVVISTKPENMEDRFELILTRPVGSLPPSEVSATFIRVVQEGFDQKIVLPPLGNNIYGSPIKLPLPGQWDVLIVVKSQNNIIFKMKDWILVK